jgi:hypothetical protein
VKILIYVNATGCSDIEWKIAVIRKAYKKKKKKKMNEEVR